MSTTARYKVDRDWRHGQYLYRVWKRHDHRFLFFTWSTWEWVVGTGTDDFDEAIQTARRLAAHSLPVYV